MEKTGNKHIQDFPPAVLYLNDLEEILKLFSENCEEVTLKTNEYENIEPSELPDLIKKLDSNTFEDIYIIGRKPYITLDLRRFGVSAYVSESSSVQLGLIAQIKELLKKKKNRLYRIIPNILTGIPMLAGFVAVALHEWLLVGGAFGFSFLMIWPSVKYQMSKTVIVFTTRKEKEIPFLQRKKDEILIALISAFCGALFSLLSVKYFGQA